MDIFISWSGPRSRAVAEALKEYLPIIVNAFNPWLSCADIDKGARWTSELSTALQTAKAGIVCLTPNNLNAPYVLFEAGALSRTVGKPYVCTLLIGMEPSDVTGPLSQFQATKPTKTELLDLTKTLNKALAESAVKEQQLEASFELCWPKLQEKLDNLPSDGSQARPKRPEREMLEELVDTVRNATAQNSRMVSMLTDTIQATNYHLLEKFAETQTLVAAALQRLPSPPSASLAASLTTGRPITLADLNNPSAADLPALQKALDDQIKARAEKAAKLAEAIARTKGEDRNNSDKT